MHYLLIVIALIFTTDIYAKDCIALKKINVDENEILDYKTQEKLLNKDIGKCLDKEVLNSVLNSISKYYINSGYITTKPYLKEQSILDGEIDISISKGILEDIVEINATRSNSNIKTAFIFQKDEPLNLRDLETSLEMMNRVPSVDAKFEIKPGTTQGGSIVV